MHVIPVSRSSNAAVRAYGIAVRVGSRAALFAKSSRCLKYAIQTGYTCLERFEDTGYTEEEMCATCRM